MATESKHATCKAPERLAQIKVAHKRLWHNLYITEMLASCKITMQLIQMKSQSDLSVSSDCSL